VVIPGPHGSWRRLGRAAIGVDGQRGDGLVDRGALVEQRLDPRPDVAEEQRTRRAEPDPLHGLGEADLEEHHGVAGEQVAGARVEDRPTAQRQHPVVGGERLGDGLALEVPEVRLTRVHEDVRDRPALQRLDVGVGVAHRHAPGVGQQGADRRLAGTHRTHQHDSWSHGHRNLSVSR
jgi:hypothetical protein